VRLALRYRSLTHPSLFSPLESDDARHDEALASRIAALNLLDLSLDHLGLITEPEDEQDRGAIAAGLAGITDRVGEGESLPAPSDPCALADRRRAAEIVDFDLPDAQGQGGYTYQGA
jgi:hypothetical protein